MASKNAEAVAIEVLDNIGKGKKVSLRKIIKKKGYAQNTADNPKLVTETQSFKDIVDPFVSKMIKERDAILVRMPKVRNRAGYHHLANALDTLTKNIRLLQGKSTNNNLNINLSAEKIAELNSISSEGEE